MELNIKLISAVWEGLMFEKRNGNNSAKNHLKKKWAIN